MNIKRNRQQGFSLIELLIVVAIMLVIAAIAIPAVANSVRAGRESAAASTLRTMNTAEQNYTQAFNGFSTTAAKMGGTAATCATGAVSATAACELEDVFATTADTGAVKSNYKFTRTSTSPQTFLWVAVPNGGILDGRREFCVVQGGAIHATPVGTVGAITDVASCLGQPTI